MVAVRHLYGELLPKTEEWLRCASGRIRERGRGRAYEYPLLMIAEDDKVVASVRLVRIIGPDAAAETTAAALESLKAGRDVMRANVSPHNTRDDAASADEIPEDHERASYQQLTRYGTGLYADVIQACEVVGTATPVRAYFWHCPVGTGRPGRPLQRRHPSARRSRPAVDP